MSAIHRWGLESEMRKINQISISGTTMIDKRRKNQDEMKKRFRKWRSSGLLVLNLPKFHNLCALLCNGSNEGQQRMKEASTDYRNGIIRFKSQGIYGLFWLISIKKCPTVVNGDPTFSLKSNPPPTDFIPLIVLNRSFSVKNIQLISVVHFLSTPTYAHAHTR